MDHAIDVPGDGYINISCIIVPLHSEATIQGTSFLLSLCISIYTWISILQVFFFGLFNTKFINDLCEDDISCVVALACECVGIGVSVFGKEVGELCVC